MTSNQKRLIKLIEQQEGTIFQKKVWKALLSIPRGEVRTYGWLAKKLVIRGPFVRWEPLWEKIGCPRKFRAIELFQQMELVGTRAELRRRGSF